MSSPPLPLQARLLNTPEVESWPAALLRARGHADARALALAQRVLRRKTDGAWLAMDTPTGRELRLPALHRAPWFAAACQALAVHPARPGLHPLPCRTLPLHRLHERLARLGLDATAYADATGLWLVPEPLWLAYAGRDLWQRPLWLRLEAARAWRKMQETARDAGIVLEAISGYRSHDYQLGIFERKRARGLSVADILQVNAAPGFSEHHSGLALDIGCPGTPPAETCFDTTAAFAWLQAHAADFGFQMSYPRDNPHGIVYEPWHWCHRPA